MIIQIALNVLAALFSLSEAVVQLWDMQELQEAVQNPYTDPSLRPLLQNAMNNMATSYMAGMPMQSIPVNVPSSMAARAAQAAEGASPPVASAPAASAPVAPAPVAPAPVAPAPVAPAPVASAPYTPYSPVLSYPNMLGGINFGGLGGIFSMNVLAGGLEEKAASPRPKSKPVTRASSYYSSASSEETQGDTLELVDRGRRAFEAGEAEVVEINGEEALAAPPAPHMRADQPVIEVFLNNDSSDGEQRLNYINWR